MAKGSGHTRRSRVAREDGVNYADIVRKKYPTLAKPFPFTDKTLEAYFNDRLKEGGYDIARSYLDIEHNAFLLQTNLRDMDDNESHAVRHLLNNSISIEVTPEGMVAYATAFKPDGTPKFSEGRIALYTYEQKTIDETALSPIGNIKKGVQHAVEKGADLALIYDRYGFIKDKKQIRQAMDEYKLPPWGKMPKAVLFISEKGKISEYKF